MQTILITGLIEENSGKTQFCKLLTVYFNSKGLTIIPYKPISGHNFYFHFKNTVRNLKRGNILSRDIQDIVHHISLPNKLPPLEILNPYHVLFTEKKIDAFLKNRQKSTYYSTISRSVPILNRCTIINDNSNIEHHYAKLTPKNSYNLVTNTNKLQDLLRNAQSIHTYSTDEELASFSAEFTERALSSTYSYLKKLEPDIFLIEGFNNIASPITTDLPNIKEDINLVLVVGPGSLLLFDTARYFQVIEEYKKYSGTKVATLEDILDYIKPVKILEIPLFKEKRNEFFKQLQTELFSKLVD